MNMMFSQTAQTTLKLRYMPGLKGLKGDKGDQGEKGDTGADSTVPGPKGDKGDQGDQGVPGADSTVPGPKGDKGDQGEQGLKGDKGDTGDIGPKGDTGDTGADSTVPGPKGDKGDKGDTGDTGPKGDKGDQGDTGPKGDPGQDGAGSGNVNYDGATPAAGEIVIAGSATDRIAGSGKTVADFATAAQGALAATAVQPAGLTKAAVGLGNVDNTSDANKPVSTAAQTALDLKAPLASPTFTGTVSGVTKAHVGLGSVDNTSDANKPVSTATQSALDSKHATAAKASAADLWTGSDDDKRLTSKAMRDAFAFVALTDASTIAVNMAAGFNFSVTLAGNRTLGAPTNSIAGQSGLILITQDGTGSRTLSFASAWKFAGGTPTASTAASTVDAIAYTVTTGGGSPTIRATYIKGFA